MAAPGKEAWVCTVSTVVALPSSFLCRSRELWTLYGAQNILLVLTEKSLVAFLC